ncbi:hypothetical protein BLA29_008455, partial [Euroglyphus maynei]
MPSQSRPAPVTTTTPIMKNSSIANSSPLLNVLLDKGKLPDFPNNFQQNSSTTPTIASITLNTSNTTSQPQIIPTAATVSTSVAQPINTTVIQNQAPTSTPNTVISQPKMIFLAPNNQTSTLRPTNAEIPAKVIVPDVKPTPNTITTRQPIVNNIRLPTPTATTTPVTIVNGDMKTPGKMNILTPTNAENSSHTNHSLENQTTELNKRLKPNDPPQVVQANGVSVTTQEMTKLPASNVQTIKMAEPQNIQSNNSNLEFECQWNNCQMYAILPGIGRFLSCTYPTHNDIFMSKFYELYLG